MAQLKAWLALPMGLACLWLVWVLNAQTGFGGVLFWLLAAAGLALFLWALGRRPLLIAAGAALMLAGAVLLAVVPLKPPGTAVQAGGPASAPYTADRLAQLRAEGRPVFVNLTAAWCITCRVNEALALSSTHVQEAFAARNVAYLVGDWTLRDPQITQLLAAYGRNGVPLYLFFAPGAARAVTLPQILTEGTVIDALSAAALPLR
jgi:thiol:disulfide interchange protein DsbD